MFRVIAAFLAGTLLATHPAAAQTAPLGGHNIPRMVEGEALKPNGSFYSGGYSSVRHDRPYRVHLYEFRQGREPADPRPDWTPWAVRLSGSGVQERRVEWADGRTCPGAYSLALALADFPTARFSRPRFLTPPVGVSAPSAPALDMGAPYAAFWGYAKLPDMGNGTMMITGSDGLIRQWVDFADQQLQDCWRPAPPQGIASEEMLRRLPEIDPTWPS